MVLVSIRSPAARTPSAPCHKSSSIVWSRPSACLSARPDALRLYGRYAAISLRGQLEYRASFVMQAAGQVLVTGVEFMAMVELVDRFGAIRSWTLQEVALFYGLISITFALADALARGFDVFGNIVKYGDFDRLLLRPRSTVLQWAAPLAGPLFLLVALQFWRVGVRRYQSTGS